MIATAVDGYPGITGQQLDYLVEEAHRLRALGRLRGVRERHFTIDLGGDESLLVVVRPRGIRVEHARAPLRQIGASTRRVRQVLAATYVDPGWWWWEQLVRLLESIPDQGPIVDTTGD